jgi:hypothetical protein
MPTLFNDYWGDIFGTHNGVINGALYFYYLNSELITTSYTNENLKANTVIIPPVEAIQSVNYSPYLEGEDVKLFITEFDEDRMPISQEGQTPAISPYMFRIINQINLKKLVGYIRRFTKRPSTTPGVYALRNPDFESKLQISPFTFGLLYDGIADPIKVEYENFNNNNNTFPVYIFQPITNQGTYAMFAKDYKGDSFGVLESGLSNRALSLPISSSTYTDYMSQNQAQYRQALKNNALENRVKFINPLAIPGAIVDTYNTINSAIAQKKDLSNSPNILKDSGSDSLFFTKFNEKYLMHYRYSIKPEYKKVIGDYFSYYGYAQNKLINVSLRSRYFYNFIKTHQINLKSQTVPKAHLEKIKNIYNTGITLWHVDRQDVELGEYKYDNFETYGNIL